MEHILKAYLRRLTNLSGNNRSLVLLRLISDQFIDIHDFDYLLNEPSFQVLHHLIAQETNIPLCEVLDSRDKDTNEVSRKLKKIQRIEKFIYEERGAKDLYLAWPFVRGKLSDGTLVRSPLLFFPIVLDIKGNRWVLNLRPDVNITLNKSFLLAYSYYNQIKLDEELIERVFDDFDKDSRVFRTSLYQLFKESPVELNFNQDNFADKLFSFKNYKKADYDSAHKNGELKLYPEAVLGIFPQAGSHLVPDYIQLLEDKTTKDIKDFFLSRYLEEDRRSPSSEFQFGFLDKVKEEQTFTPFKMDAFQENALKAIKKGNSVVVQGPPGTGKSQLICNLISDFIARDKKVLLVSQKRAALDVVFRRLEEKEISQFVGLVHDFKNDRKEIYQKIAKQIDSLYEHKMKNISLDAIQLERKFLQASRLIDQISEELEEFKFALFDESEANISIKELYLTSDLSQPSIDLRLEYKHFQLEQMQKFVRNLGFYTSYAAQLEKPDYPWKDRKSFNPYGIPELKRLKEVLLEIPDFNRKLAKKIKKIIDTELSVEICEAILGNSEKIMGLMDQLQDPEIYRYFQHMVGFKDQETDSLWFSNIERIVMECYKGEGPEVSLTSKDLGRFQDVLQRSIKARKGIIRWLRWKLFSKDKIFITRVMVANGLNSNRKGFKILVKKIDDRLNLEHNLTKIRNNEWLVGLPSGMDKIDFQNWFYKQKKALNAKLLFSTLRNFKQYFNVRKLAYLELSKKFEEFLKVIEPIPLKKAEWLNYLTKTQINRILEDEINAERLNNALIKDFDSLCEFDKLRDDFEPVELKVLEKLYDEVSEQKELNIDVIELFQNSVKLAWIDHIEIKYPILRAVSSLKFEKLVKELQENVKQKYLISNEILLLKARERTYKNVEYNRLNNLVTYRDLNHQVTKKRRIWPIRKLVAHYGDELFDLVPCWMASPESVSAIFPMEEVFDLVIFDEASQCFVERGIPAMYRGAQVVIAGDDKQLKPNDLYKVRWEDDSDDESVELEVDSLLNLANQYLMQAQLRGHYRSKSLDLIDFSNFHFYNGNLKLLPDFIDINKGEPAIKYNKVDGIWADNINEVEANEVVRIVEDLINKAPEKEIGIVTFNVKQQDFIMDLLETAAIERTLKVPDSLFVKNIENVQGDEKDIIIFSTAYAPDKDGKMTIKFGSLNIQHGENRLNVAITRAREAVHVVSSIYPEQLKVGESKNEGPKLLKKYLQYARDVSEGKYKPKIKPLNGHSADWFLKNKILKFDDIKGQKVELSQELPFADITVKKEGKYTGLLLTDDNLYHQAISVKEAHVYTPFTLSKKNWKFTYLSSRGFWNDPESIRERLLRFFN